MTLYISVKGYLRKGAIHLGLKESSRAMDAYQKAMDLDPKCQVCVQRICSVSSVVMW